MGRTAGGCEMRDDLTRGRDPTRAGPNDESTGAARRTGQPVGGRRVTATPPQSASPRNGASDAWTGTAATAASANAIAAVVSPVRISSASAKVGEGLADTTGRWGRRRPRARPTSRVVAGMLARSPWVSRDDARRDEAVGVGLGVVGGGPGHGQVARRAQRGEPDPCRDRCGPHLGQQVGRLGELGDRRQPVVEVVEQARVPHPVEDRATGRRLLEGQRPRWPAARPDGESRWSRGSRRSSGRRPSDPASTTPSRATTPPWEWAITSIGTPGSAAETSVQEVLQPIGRHLDRSAGCRSR